MSAQYKQLEHLLASNKKLPPEALQSIKKFIHTNKIPRVPIFRMTPMMHYLIYFLRTQVFLYACVDIGVAAYNIKTKWHRQKIRTKLIVLSGLSLLAVVGMIKGSAAITRRAVRQINYLPETNRFNFQFMNPWFGINQVQVAAAKVIPLAQKRWYQQVNYSIQSDTGVKRNLTTKIFGQWTNKKLYEHIVKQKSL